MNKVNIFYGIILILVASCSFRCVYLHSVIVLWGDETKKGKRQSHDLINLDDIELTYFHINLIGQPDVYFSIDCYNVPVVIYMNLN